MKIPDNQFNAAARVYENQDDDERPTLCRNCQGLAKCESGECLNWEENQEARSHQ
jgi:hypothetical protein